MNGNLGNIFAVIVFQQIFLVTIKGRNVQFIGLLCRQRIVSFLKQLGQNHELPLDFLAFILNS